MVRKSKEDAQLTRSRIITAAREVFLSRGVSRSTLEHIATQANLTRGAIYWHFKNKTEIFHAIREQVLLPLIDRIDDSLTLNGNEDPLTQIEKSLCQTIDELNDNVAMRETYEIIMIKCEYVEDFSEVLQQILDNCSSILDKLVLGYQRAEAQNLLSCALSPQALAQDTHLFFGGLLHMWVKDTDGSRFRNQAKTLIQSHMNLRRKH